MKNLLAIFLALLSLPTFAQKWVDTTFSIQTTLDTTYGSAVDFAGKPQDLQIDISVPKNDAAPVCGRPLLVVVHGGAWVVGDKSMGFPRRVRRDFAKRGYVTAAIQYRQGQFLTNQFKHCNVENWDCANLTAESEWYRANHRAAQDLKGALRFLINNSATYTIDPKNVFLVGESAGGFIAMSAAFIDDSTEVLQNLIGAFPDAPKPNSHYETKCVQKFNYAASIDSMNLSRPALGSYEGTLNLPLQKPYSIRAVGNFYGGVFNNIFQSFSGASPALYLYHQPCDLVVPFDYDRVLEGVNDCAKLAGCGTIINRPFVYGAEGIKDLIDDLKKDTLPAPDYKYDVTTLSRNCLQQIPPNPGCHVIDSYWNRTRKMARYFAEQMDSCEGIGNQEFSKNNLVVEIFPNPAENWVQIDFQEKLKNVEVSILDLSGVLKSKWNFSQQASLRMELNDLSKGIYFIQVKTERGILVKKMVLN